MKLLDSSDSLTDFGSMLLEKMAAYPRRFLFGIDTETKYSQGSAAAWEDSVEKYELFLDKGSLTIADKRMIKYTNAVGLFS